jgi:integrase/recombinase XerC
LDFLTGFLNYISTEKRFSKHTENAYTSDLNQFVSFLKDSYQLDSPVKASSQMIRSWVIDLMEKENSPRSVNRKLSTLKSFYRYLIREGEVIENPMTKVSAPKVKSRLPSFVDKDSMSALLSTEMFEDDFAGQRDRLILMLLYYTGMRRSELIGLNRSSFDLHNRSLKVLGKGNKERIIPVNDELTLLMQQYISKRDEQEFSDSQDNLLVTDSGKALYPNFVYRTVRNHLSKVSTSEKRSPHVLRHTFATHMLNNGADLNSIKEILGHANLSATQIYTHNSIEQLKLIYKQAHPKA